MCLFIQNTATSANSNYFWNNDSLKILLSSICLLPPFFTVQVSDTGRFRHPYWLHWRKGCSWETDRSLTVRWKWIQGWCNQSLLQVRIKFNHFTKIDSDFQRRFSLSLGCIQLNFLNWSPNQLTIDWAKKISMIIRNKNPYIC